MRERIWGEIGVVVDEVGDEGHAWKSLFDNRGKVLMLPGKRVSVVQMEVEKYMMQVLRQMWERSKYLVFG